MARGARKGKRPAPDGGIYLIAQTLDRGLYQLLRYQSDGQLTVLLENGDKSLYQLWAGNDKLVAQTDNGDARLSLIFDLRSSDVRYRQPLEYRYNGRDDARQTVIEPESHYGDDGSPTALLRPLSFHHAVNMKNLPCCWLWRRRRRIAGAVVGPAAHRHPAHGGAGATLLPAAAARDRRSPGGYLLASALAVYPVACALMLIGMAIQTSRASGRKIVGINAAT